MLLMSLQRTCCCDDGPDYYILQPCHLSAVSKKYMSAASWNACGFNTKQIYKNGYCGYWRGSPTVGDTLDSTCGNYTVNAAGCCGSTFDPCPDNPTCCGYQECLEYREANSQPVPLSLNTYTYTANTAGSSWATNLTSITIGARSFYNPGTADFRYLVSGTIEVSWTADPGGTIDCNGNARPPTRSVPFEFYVTHDWIGPSCFDTDTADSTIDPCDYSVAVCPGTTTTTGSGFTACDILRAEPNSATMNSGFPSFGDDCTPPGTSYSVTIEIGVDLTATNPAVDDCISGCTGSPWASAYFPDVNTTVEITLQGLWQ